MTTNKVAISPSRLASGGDCPPITEELLQAITQRIVEAFHPHQVILFGSYAYGTPHPDSDIDLFVVMDSQETISERILKVYQVANQELIPMDVVVRTPQEVAQRLAIGDPFVGQVLSQGRRLYP